MPIAWPSSLVAELAARRCIIFAGAGVSAACVGIGGAKPPTWRALLNQLARKAALGTDLATVNDLLNKERYLDAAEIILDSIAPADRTAMLRETFGQQAGFQPSAMHRAIRKIDPKVVVTTNFDEIYDNFCRSGEAVDGYNVCKYFDPHFVADLRSPVRLIVKAHGCISNPQQIVLCKSDYFRARQVHASFYRVLDSVFLTSTILFVGYSLSDPDIQLVLENATIAAQSAHTHYALMQDDTHGALRAATERATNVRFLTYPAGDFEAASAGLDELAAEVEQFREKHRD